MVMLMMGNFNHVNKKKQTHNYTDVKLQNQSEVMCNSVFIIMQNHFYAVNAL